MPAATRLQHQRSVGHVGLRTERAGLARLREAGSAKVRFPQGGCQAILINTGGGLAGGDDFTFDIEAGAGTRLTITTQAAERVYRSLGPPATIATQLRAGPAATLAWLPQETILFDGAALTRSITADLAGDARFLAVESFIFGRAAMGETVASAALRDRWRIRHDGNLIFADDLVMLGALPCSPATRGHAGAMATVLLVSSEADSMIERARELVGAEGGASAWSGKLVARLLAKDGFELRKSLFPLLRLLAGDWELPGIWSL